MIGPGFSIDRHWSRVRDAFTENYKNDILWLITLRGTKVRDSLFNWGCISSPICASCNRRETIDHCFLYCTRVKNTWFHFSPLLTRVLGTQFTLSLLSVFFLFSTSFGISEKIESFFILLLRLFCMAFGFFAIGPPSKMEGKITAPLLSLFLLIFRCAFV